MDWVLLNGLTRLATQWRGLPEELSARCPGARVHALDHPGVGTAADERAPWSVHAMAERVRARWLADSESGGRTGLLGSSLGGMVALAWAARHPGEVAACAVLNTSARDCGWPLARLRPAAMRMLIAARGERTPLERERRVLALLCSHDEVREPAAVELAAALEAGVPSDAVALRQLAAGLRFRAPALLEVPLLVLSGRGDRLVSPRCSARLAALYAADHREHPTAGHELALDAPEWCAARVAEWAR